MYVSGPKKIVCEKRWYNNYYINNNGKVGTVFRQRRCIWTNSVQTRCIWTAKSDNVINLGHSKTYRMGGLDKCDPHNSG